MRGIFLTFTTMDGLLLILVFGVLLGLIMVFKQQNNKGGNDKDRTSEGSEE